MKIVFIGAGNLATHLSQALSKAGHDIVQVYSRTKEAAHVLASKIGASSTNDIKEIVCNADIYIFSVKDDVLPSVVEPLCGGARDALFLHTAGSVSMTIFKGKALRYGVLYPMQSFTKSRELDLSDVPVYIEGDSEATLSTIRLLAESVSKKVRVMDSEKRRKLHLAAVFASNFVNCCYDLASEIMRDIDADFSDFLPLIDETASKVHDITPRDAQTGPAVRYDQNVMMRQLELLQDRPVAHKVYEVMSEAIHELHVLMDSSC